MQFTKAKTKEQRKREAEGLPIKLVLVEVESVLSHTLKINGKNKKVKVVYDKKLEMVYKQIKKDHSQDLFFRAKINRDLPVEMKDTDFVIKKITDIKVLSNGIYEE